MQLPDAVPVLTLPNVILFPQALLPLYIYEPRYRKMLADALATHRLLTVAMQKPGRSRETPSAVAGLGLIRASVTNKDGTSNLILQGLARVELEASVRYRPYRVSRVRPLPPAPRAGVAVHALSAKVLELVGERLKQGIDLPFKTLNGPSAAEPQNSEEPAAVHAFRQVVQHLSKLDDPEQLADLVSATLLGDAGQRQVILETLELEERLRHLVKFLLTELQRPHSNTSHE